jgi:hypothetical protein
MSSPKPDAHRDWAAAADRRGAKLRWMVLGAILLALVQAGLGMVVNLYVNRPAHHPGAHPANYFAGSPTVSPGRLPTAGRRSP